MDAIRRKLLRQFHATNPGQARLREKQLELDKKRGRREARLVLITAKRNGWRLDELSQVCLMSRGVLVTDEMLPSINEKLKARKESEAESASAARAKRRRNREESDERLDLRERAFSLPSLLPYKASP